MRYVTLIIVLLACVSIFSISQKAIEYYSAAELSYKSGDYATALRNYELALTTDPTIEGYDSYIKFKMGISAYMVGNYDKARSYLSGYNTSFVRELLSSIDKRQAQDEWKRWILKNKPIISEVSTKTTSSITNKKIVNVIMPIAIFLIIFASLMFAEIRILKIKKQVVELPLNPEKDRALEKVEQEMKIVEGTKKEVKVEDEITSLIPENAKIVDFEKLINSEIDIFKDLFEGTVSMDQILLEEEGSKTELTEVQEPQETQQEQEILEKEDRKTLIEDILQESKELIENLEIEQPKEVHSTLQVELSEIESKFINKLNEYSSNIPSEKELGVEELEKIQQDFAYFDDLEKITDEDSKLLVKKLLAVYRGENS